MCQEEPDNISYEYYIDEEYRTIEVISSWTVKAIWLITKNMIKISSNENNWLFWLQWPAIAIVSLIPDIRVFIIYSISPAWDFDVDLIFDVVDSWLIVINYE